MNVALEQLGFEKFGNEILYDGTTGKQLACSIFIAPVFNMRLKHLVADLSLDKEVLKAVIAKNGWSLPA